MKPSQKKPLLLNSLRPLLSLSLPLATALVALLAAPSAQAITYYWDQNSTTTGFGAGTGTWTDPTVSRWSTSNVGTATPGASIITTTSDALHFGTDTTGNGLTTGSITVTGTVNAASLRFGSQTTGNITLSGGIINLPAVTSIHVGAGSTTVHTISSSLTGAGTSLTKTGNSLTLSGTNSYTGSTIITSGTLTLANASALGTNPGVNGTSGITIQAGSILQSATAGANPTTTIFAPITLAGTGDTTLRVGQGAASNTHTFKLNGAIGGATNNLVFTTSTASFNNGSTVFVLGAPGTYTGNTLITTGNGANNPVTVKSNAVNALPTSTVLSLTGGSGGGSGRTLTYDLSGNDQTLAGLTNTIVGTSARNHRISNTGALATLTINNSADFTYGGVGTSTTFNGAPVNPNAQITGPIALTKNGAGKFTLAAGAGNSFTGPTKILGGILNLGHSTSIQSSTLDTAASIVGDAGNGLQTSLTTLTFGGLSGDKNLANVFTSSSGGYTGLATLTLNLPFGVTQSYAADIGDGAGGMNLIMSGGGTQVFTVPQTHTGTTSSTTGALIATNATVLPAYNVAGKLVFNGGTLGAQVGGAGWTTGEVDTLLANATKTSGFLGIDTTNGSLTQWTAFTTTNFGPTLGLNKLGANNLTLNQANTFAGSTTVSQGTLTLANPLALQNSPLITTAAGTLILDGITTLSLGGLNGATGDLGTIITSGYSGLTALTLNTPPTLPGSAITYSGSIIEGAAGMTLTKNGVGSQVLVGANSYTGATQVNEGLLVFRNKAAKAGGTVTAAAAGSIGLGVKAADAAFYSAAEFGDLFNTNTLPGFSLDAASGAAIDTTAGSYDQTVSLTGTRSLTKVGANTLTLSTENTYSGATSLTNGTLSLTHNDALGTTAGATTIHGGNGTTANTLSLSAATTDLTIPENFNFTGNTVGRAQLSHSALSRFHTLTGNIDVTSDTNLVQFSVTAASADLATVGGVTLTGNITGALTNGAGFLLRGNASGSVSPVNSITGNITLTGAGLIKTDSNTWTIGSTGKTYSAPTIGAANGILKMGVADYISASAPELIMGNSSGGSTGIFDLNGFNQTVKGITYNGGSLSTGTKTVTNSDAVNAAVLTVNNATDFSPTGGSIANSVVLTGNLGLTKQGVGNLTLSANNTYTGATTVTGGTLNLGVVNCLADTTAISLGAGTLAAANAVTDTVGTLDVTAATTINLGTGATLAFADSSAVDWTGGTLNLTGFVPGSSLRFGTTNAGLTPAQLSKITAAGFTGFTLDANGFLTSGPTLGSFTSTNFGGETNPAIVGPTADPDKDGVINVFEYAFGMSPNAPSRANLPAAGTAVVGPNTFVSCVYTRVEGASDLSFAVQFSNTPDDSGFTNAVQGVDYTLVSTVDNGSTETITIRDNTPVTAGQKRFVRIFVTYP